MCEPQAFEAITIARFEKLIAAAASNGIEISGNSGQSSQNGFTVTWNYDPVGELLYIQCTEKPFFAPCSMIASKIEDLVKSTA